MYYMPYGDDEAENEAEHGDPDGDASFMYSPEAEEDGPSTGFAGVTSGYILVMILAAILAVSL